MRAESVLEFFNLLSWLSWFSWHCLVGIVLDVAGVFLFSFSFSVLACNQHNSVCLAGWSLTPWCLVVVLRISPV